MRSYDRYTDEQLVAVVQVSRDLAAFDALFTRHRSYLKRFLHAFSPRDAQDVDDVLQETLIKAFTHIDTFRYEATFSTWLLRIGRNEMMQATRKQKVFARLRGAFQRLGQVEVEHRDSAGSTADVEAFLDRLPDTDRLVLVYCDALGFSHGDAAKELDLPVGTVKSTLARARKRSRQYFEPPETEDKT